MTTAQPFRRSVIHLSAMYPNRCQRSFRSKQRSPSLPGKQMVREDHWSFDHGTWRASGPSAPRWTIGVLFWSGKGRCPTLRVPLGSAAARDCSPPGQGGPMEPRSRPGGRPVLRRQPNDRNFVLLQHGMRPMVGPLLVRGCKGLQPSRSGRTIGALILEGVRSLGAVAGRCKLCFAATRHAP